MADDWGYPHEALYGDEVVKMPTFDRLAKQGLTFSHAYVAASTCTASRASTLTGQMPYRLEESCNLFSSLDVKFKTYPDILEAAGYSVGLNGKGWGPGNEWALGRMYNPAGRKIPGKTPAESFRNFLKKTPSGKPFCFWFGSSDPHRPYVAGSGKAAGMNPQDVQVPPYLPDCDETRGDILDYYAECQRFDSDCESILKVLDELGLADNTIVVMTGDNGFPFPRAKSTCYESGVREPLAIRWPAKIKAGRRVDDFVSFTDFAPTFLQAAGVAVPADMTGSSFMDVLTSQNSGQIDPSRDRVIVGRERHARGRPGKVGFPSRAIITKDYEYIRNYHPERGIAGTEQDNDGTRSYCDVDEGPCKTYMLEHRNDVKVKPLFDMAFGKPAAEELFDLRKDPDQMVNVAHKPEYAAIKKELSDALTAYLRQTNDPRELGKGDVFDKYPIRMAEDGKQAGAE